MEKNKYVVHSDVDENNIYKEFDNRDAAIQYAKDHIDAETWVDLVVEDEDGLLGPDYMTIWSYQDEGAYDMEFPKSDLEDIPDDWIEDTTPADWDDVNRFPKTEDLDIKEAVNKLEENESEVECKCCFELFPKEACIKTDDGYVCQKCNQELHSHQGTNLDLIDADPFDLSYDDPRLPEEETEPEVKEEPVDETELRKHEKAIEENKLEESQSQEIGDTYKKLSKLYNVNLEDLVYGEDGFMKSCYPEGFPDFAGDVIYSEKYWTEFENWLKEKGIVLDDKGIKDLSEIKLDEHVNEEHPAIESDQVLHGTDNAVVDCEVAKVIAHSEDEKPLDCKMEKPTLEEPLAGKEVDIKINEDIAIKDLSSKQKDEVMVDLAKALGKQDVNTFSAGITREPGGIAYENKKVQDIQKAIFEENLTEELDKEIPWILQQGEDGEPEFIGWAKSEDDLISQMVTNHLSDIIYENTYINELDKETYEYMKKDGNLSEDEIKELDKYFGIAENLEEAKKDDELPVDPEAAKLEVHTMLNNLVADEIEAVNGYEEAKAEILDAPIAHKDIILDKVDHIEDEEKEHIDELIDATTEIPFDKEEAPAPAVKEPVAEPEPEVIPEEPVVEEGYEDPFYIDFPKNEEKPLVEVAAPLPFDSDVKIGDKIKIIHLTGENNDYDGKEGEVTDIDSIGQLHGTWGGLAVIPGVDEYEVITAKSFNEGVSLTNPLLKKGLAYLNRYPQKFAYVCSYLNNKTHQQILVDKGFDSDAELQAYIKELFKDKNVVDVSVLRQGDQDKYLDAMKEYK